MVKSVGISVIFSALLFGVGQIYLDRVNRGVIILGVGLALSVGMSWYLGWWGSLFAIGFWIWQIIDAYKIAKKGQEPSARSKADFQKGW